MTDLKEQVRQYWNRQSCDTDSASSEKFSLKYFEEIENYRYTTQPFIHSFAQFTRYRGKKVLEVGYGAGTDFIQWLRAGARATGIDLTQEAHDNLTHRIQVYGLPSPEFIGLGDAENLPFPSDSFDLGYSFGVLHHSPNTETAVKELVRIVRPGGEIKIMLYNRNSIWVYNHWIKFALLQGKPWKSLRWVLWNHMESVGTKAYTRKELRNMLAPMPLEQITVRTEMTAADYLSASAFKPLNLLGRTALWLAGDRPNWQVEDCRKELGPRKHKGRVEFFGNRMGFFHCISARKLERP